MLASISETLQKQPKVIQRYLRANRTLTATIIDYNALKKDQDVPSECLAGDEVASSPLHYTYKVAASCTTGEQAITPHIQTLGLTAG